MQLKSIVVALCLGASGAFVAPVRRAAPAVVTALPGLLPLRGLPLAETPAVVVRGNPFEDAIAGIQDAFNNILSSDATASAAVEAAAPEVAEATESEAEEVEADAEE